VIPTAYEDLFPPSPRWRLELYLTPSHLVFSTAGVLCGLSIGIAMLIALLHAREKVCKEYRHFNIIMKFNFIPQLHSTKTPERGGRQSTDFTSMPCDHPSTIT